MEPRAKEVVLFQSTSALHSRRRSGLMKNGLHIRLTSCSLCSQVGLASAGSKHDMVSGFFPKASAGAAGGPGPATAGGNDSTWSPSGGHATQVASVPPVPLPSGSASDSAFPVYAVGSASTRYWKSDGSVRLGLDLSSPIGASVTSGISREEFAVRYTSSWMRPWPLCTA